MLRVLIALAVLVGSVQCAAACTPVSCVDPQPPCHHHKQAPASQKSAGCTHDLVPAATVQSPLMDVLLESQIVESFVAGAFVRLYLPVVSDPSPPTLSAALPFVLRI
jgi:hypothetical protein